MNLDGLAQALTDLRDEAHRLAIARLDSGIPDAARLARARELDARLAELRTRIDAEPSAARAHYEDIAQMANRYLIFVLAEADETPPATIEDRARALHNEVIEAGKSVANGTLAGPDRDKRVASLVSAFQELLADPARSDPALERLLSDIDLDIEFIRQGGQAPSSLRLARELLP